MHNAGLADCTRVGNATVFQAARNHPGARHLRFLLSTPPPVPAGKTDTRAQDQVRAWLKAYGAPLEANLAPGDLPSLESVFVKGVTLAPNDVSVARTLPVFLWKNRSRLNHSRLWDEALNHGERHMVGFFLDLTGRLGDDQTLVSAAERFRDRRRRKPRDFFPTKSSLERELAEERTPPVARSWQYRMNMSMQTFSTTFERFTRDAQVQG